MSGSGIVQLLLKNDYDLDKEICSRIFFAQKMI